jgi:hypothetical protein
MHRIHLYICIIRLNMAEFLNLLLESGSYFLFRTQEQVNWEPCADISNLRLTEHATNKHSKTLKDCFPSFEEAPKK